MSIALSLRIFVVGKIKDKAIRQKCLEYYTKIKYDANISVFEIKDSDKNTEGEKIIKAIQKNKGYTFALSESGAEFSSVRFAYRLEHINQPINFIIGGHHGLSDTVFQNSTESIALSKMTFTHEFARLILMEQLYRALSIINNRKYHRE